MKPYKWLKRCVDNYRPALSWGHIVTYEGKEVAITSNGYAAHLDWDVENLPRVKVGEHILIPFEWSTVGTAWNEEVQIKPPNMVKFIEAHDKDGRSTLTFRRRDFLEGLERIGTKRFSPISIYVGADNKCVFAGDRTFTELLCEKVDADFPVVSADTQLLRRAIPKGETKVSIHALDTEESEPIIVGQWGRRCAFVMPISSFGGSKKWQNRRYRVAQTILNKDAERIQGEIEF